MRTSFQRTAILLVIAVALTLLLPPVYAATLGKLVSRSLPSSIVVVRSGGGEELELSFEDYLTGCLFAEIPIDYNEAALRAQAVAAHTYALKLLEVGGTGKISDNPADGQAYFTPEEAREYYSGAYDEYYESVRSAAEYGAKRIITYDGELAYSVYHSVSAGATNSAKNVWDREIPYLVSVDSAADLKAPDYLCTNEMSIDAVRLAILSLDAEVEMPLEYSRWFGATEYDESGYVLTTVLDDTEYTGAELWRKLSLRSPAYEVAFRGGKFVITTKGYGHGAGMSQYGANAMANGGATAEEILEHYYSGATVITAQ